MKVATAEYEHSALELVKPNADGAKVQVGGDPAVATQIKIKTPADGNPEALYSYADTADAAAKATDALLISKIAEKSTLHIFSGKLDAAGTSATTFTIPEKEVPVTKEEAQKLKTFADLTKYATDFKWIK